MILIIRVPARPSRLISRRSSFVDKRANSNRDGPMDVATTSDTTLAYEPAVAELYAASRGLYGLILANCAAMRRLASRVS